EVGLVLRAVDLVAVEAADVAVVHDAFREVVALHAIFVRGEVGELVEVGDAGLEIFEAPVVGEALAGDVADGPVVVLAVDGTGERAALAVALDAGVVGGDGGEARGVHDVVAGGVRDVKAAGSVALFTADVPLGDLMGVDVVVDGVAAVAERAGGALHVGVGVEGGPPVGAFFGVVGKPFFL